MSPASKSKDKRASGKTPSKPPTNGSTGGGIPTSGYNPLLGTFHTLDTAPLSSAPPLHVNSRFRNIDEMEDQNSFGGTGESDSVSNNGSWSGESEDHKDKISHLPSRQETIIPGSDSDKREKIRQKNERKHQRQKEKRAQELHERCRGYLMSRKLELLAQKLVQMGFPSEKATMALILNDGRVEESVNWLFEEAEETDENSKEQNLEGGRNLKIDISEELAQLADMEAKFKCSKQDVERAVIACEGDLEQAADTLRAQKQDPMPVPPKPEETGDPPSFISKAPALVPPTSQSRPQPKPTLSTGTTILLQKREEKDFNYTKMTPTPEPGSKNMQLLKKIQPKMEWTVESPIPVPSATEKRWPVVAGSSPSASYSLASSTLQGSQHGKTEARFMSVGNELKNLQLGSVKEPVVVMQRSQLKQQIPAPGVSSSSSSSSLSIAAADWYPKNGVEPVVMKSNSFPTNNTRRDSSLTFVGTNHQMYDQIRFQQPPQKYVSVGGGPLDPGQSVGMNQGNGGLWNRTGNISPTLSAASSLGLFSGLGSTNGGGALGGGPSSPTVDWNAGDSTLLHLDYTNIDWSLDRALPSRQSMTWQGISSFSSMQQQQSSTNAYVAANAKSSTFRPVLSNSNSNNISNGGGGGGGVSNSIGRVEDGIAAAETLSGGGGGSREWTSPFEEKDLFNFPRQFVSSPSLL